MAGSTEQKVWSNGNGSRCKVVLGRYVWVPAGRRREGRWFDLETSRLSTGPVERARNSLVLVWFIEVVLICGIIWFVGWAHIYEVLVWNKPFIQTFYTSFGNVLSYILLLITLAFLRFNIYRHKRFKLHAQRAFSKPVRARTQIARLEAEREELRRKVWSYRRLPTRLAGYVVTFVGASVLAGSMVFSSTVWAIVGLTLTFWGVFFFFLKPTSLVKASLLDSASSSLLENVGRLVSEFGLKGKGVYLPPRYLEDLSSGLVYISTKDEVYVPTLREVEEVEGKVFLKNPDGVCLVPSGVALTNLFEEELGTSFAKVNLEFLERNLPKVLVEALEIAEDFELTVKNGRVRVRIEGSIYKDVCDEIRRVSGVCESFACPLCSSVACALARASGRPVVLDGNEVSGNGNAMDVYYRVLEE